MSEKSKEEIRDKWIRDTPLLKLSDCVDGAMTEFAKQECIAFKNWCEKNEQNEDYAHEETLTTEQLYFYYDQQNNKDNVQVSEK